MPWNPDPKVAAARDLAKQYGKSHVIIVMLDDQERTITMASYGENSQKCEEARVLGARVQDAVILAWELDD